MNRTIPWLLFVFVACVSMVFGVLFFLQRSKQVSRTPFLVDNLNPAINVVLASPEKRDRLIKALQGYIRKHNISRVTVVFSQNGLEKGVSEAWEIDGSNQVFGGRESEIDGNTYILRLYVNTKLFNQFDASEEKLSKYIDGSILKLISRDVSSVSISGDQTAQEVNLPDKFLNVEGLLPLFNITYAQTAG